MSILAEIVQVRAATAKTAVQSNAPALQVINIEAKDPICGMMVDKGKAKHKAEFQGKTFYFCCAGCKQTFEQTPQRYALATS